MENLLRLVKDPAVLHRAWEREPVVSTGLGGFDDVFTPGCAERLIGSGLPVGSLRLFRDGELLPTASVARRRERGGGDRERLVDPGKVTEQVAAGATVVLEELRSYLPAVAAFADGVTRESGYGTYCAAFLTPANGRGVAAHYDTASAFLRQIHGSKHWRVWAPRHRWPSRASTAATDTGLVLEATLKEGDCLYIPRGYIHSGEATGDASVHLSVAMRPVTWARVLQSAIAACAEDSEALREAVPALFADSDPEGLLRQRLAGLVEQLSCLDAAALTRLIRQTAPPPPPSRPGSLERALKGPLPHGDH